MKTQDFGTLIQDVRTHLGPLRQAQPELMQHFGALGKAALAPGALDAKFKELIALAIAVATRCDDCIGFHTQTLAKLGAQEHEILETLGVNVYMGGGPSLMYASHAIAAFREFAQAQDPLDQVKSAGVLKVGLEGTYPPFGYRDAAGKLSGFDVDVITEVAKRMGVKPEFVTTEWSGIIAGLQAGKFDVIANQVAVTPEREKALDFSQPYIYSAAQVIQRKNDDRNFDSLQAMKGKKVGVVLGSNYVPMVKAVPGVDVQTYPGAVEVLSDLAGGRLDAGVNDRLLLPYLIKQSKLPLRTGALLPGESTRMAIPFRKGNPKFAEAMDAAFTAMRQDGTLKSISMKWLGADTTEAPKS